MFEKCQGLHSINDDHDDVVDDDDDSEDLFTLNFVDLGHDVNDPQILRATTNPRLALPFDC